MMITIDSFISHDHFNIQTTSIYSSLNRIQRSVQEKALVNGTYCQFHHINIYLVLEEGSSPTTLGLNTGRRFEAF